MERSWKIILFILLGVIVTLLIINLRKRDDRIEHALSKLDSTQNLLEIATADLDSSKIIIGNMQGSLHAYSVYLSDVRNKVDHLNEQWRKSEVEFNKRIRDAKTRYEETKTNINKYRRTSWPEILIDTTR